MNDLDVASEGKPRPLRLRDRTSDWWALATFVVVIAVSLPLILYLGRDMWFRGDEWDFLVERSFGDVLEPHNHVHWTTIPVIVYRLLYRFIGLHNYLPYQVIVVLLHLTAAVLLRVVMRRAGVGPWIATVAASLFALFGSGYPNIIWGFQIAFTGALTFGLCQLLLAGHDGPLDRRDWVGLAFGFMALLCSGAGITMVVVVGIATFMLRGLRAAAFHTVPLAAVYALWWFSFANPSEVDGGPGSPDLWVEFTARGVGSTFDSLGQIPGVGILLGLVLVVGLLIAWIPLEVSEFRRRAAYPAAMLIGAIIFLLIAAVGRVAAEFGDGLIVLGPEGGSAARYQHIVAALVLPAIAVAADALARRWRVALPAVVVLLVVGIPGNVAALADPDSPQYEGESAQARRDYVISIPQLPIAREVPRSTDAGPGPAIKTLTVGWLVDALDAGRIPDPGPVTAGRAANLSAQLAVSQTDAPGTGCVPIDPDEEVRLDRGESIEISGTSLEAQPRYVYIASDGTESRPIAVRLLNGGRFVAVADTVTLRVESSDAVESVRLCSG